MSYHRANVIWRSPDGTWNRGFYADDYLTCGGNDDQCGDETHEWCREFDETRFSWVSTGHPDEDSAYRAWNGANPGSCTVYDNPDDPAIDEFEDMAAVRYEYAQEQAAKNPSHITGLYGGSYRHPGETSHWGYTGPAKQRSLTAIQKQRDTLIENWVSTYLHGYDNMRQVDEEQRLDRQIAERLKNATSAERAAYEEADAHHRDRIRDLLDRARKQRNDRFRAMPWGRHHDLGYGRHENKLSARENEIEALIEQTERTATTKRTADPVDGTAPKRASTARAGSGPAGRGKTTAKSTAGSFAPKPQTQADAGTFPADGTRRTAWGDADDDELPF